MVNEPSSPATPPVVAHVYGGLFVWTPATGAPAQIGGIVRDFTVAQAGSVRVFLDLAAPSNDAATTGTLVRGGGVVVRGGRVQPHELAEGVVDAQAAWRLSSDGNTAIVTVRGATAADPGPRAPGVVRERAGADAVDGREPALADDDPRRRHRRLGRGRKTRSTCSRSAARPR